MRDTEKIIQELYALDSSLRELESDIRVLVPALLSARPDVQADQPFLDNLRRTLLARADAKEVEPTYTSISWWMVRLVPIGAIAILTLTLLPTRQFSPVDLAPEERGGGMGGDSIETSSSEALFKTESAPSMMTAEDAPAPEPIILPAVTVDVPSFIVVHVSVDGVLGEIVGVSKLLFPGTTVGVQINLLRGTHESESFVGVLYADNGDGLFGVKDAPMFDTQNGTPLYIPLN